MRYFNCLRSHSNTRKEKHDETQCVFRHVSSGDYANRFARKREAQVLFHSLRNRAFFPSPFRVVAKTRRVGRGGGEEGKCTWFLLNNVGSLRTRQLGPVSRRQLSERQQQFEQSAINVDRVDSRARYYAKDEKCQPALNIASNAISLTQRYYSQSWCHGELIM